jgi:drug/metabolite transporter (DMT)-like permease
MTAPTLTATLSGASVVLQDERSCDQSSAMAAGAQVPVKLVIGLAVAVALDTALQLVWKTGIAELPDTSSVWQTIVAIARHPIFILVVAFMAAQLVNWLKVLDHADLSYAKPFTSLSYVTVCILSVVLLGEHIAPLQVLGIVIVIAGVWCVSQTGRTTLADGPATPDPVRGPEHAPINVAEAEPE